MKEIKAKLLDVNEDKIKIVRLPYKDGDFIKKGDVIIAVETTKVAEYIEAEEEGYIKYFVKEGDTVPPGALMAIIYSYKDEVERYKLIPENKQEDLSKEIKITKKARKLAKELGVDITKIKKKGVIKTKDIEEFINLNKGETKKEDESYLFNINLDFYNNLIRDKEKFSLLSSPTKCLIYRVFGAKIGKNVFIGEGSYIHAKYIEIGDNVFIGKNVVIEADIAKIDNGVTIDDRVFIRTKMVVINNSTTIINNCEIGGGSSFEEDSGIRIGEDCLIINSLINTTKEVVIGNRVAISPGVKIYTHQHWHNIFYKGITKFEKVIIGNDVHITSNVVIAPGVQIGNSVLVKPNTLVDRNIESNTIVQGNPLVVVDSMYLSKELNLKEKEFILEKIVKPDICRRLKNMNLKCPEIKIASSLEELNNTKKGDIIFSLIPIEEDIKEPERLIFDLSKMQILGNYKNSKIFNEIRYTLRRYGLRMKPTGWRYEN